MKQLTSRNIRVLSLSIAFFVILYIFSLTYLLDNENTYSAFKELPLTIFVYLGLISLLNYFFRFYRWYVFLHPMNKQISILKHCCIYISGFALTTTPGKIGETMRSVYLFSLNIKYANSLGAFFSERLLDVVSVLILSVMLFMFSYPEYFFWIISSVIFVGFVFLLFRSKFLTFAIKKFVKNQSKSSILEFQNTIKNLLSNVSLIKVLPLSLLAWGVQSYGLVVIVNALGFEENIWLIMGIYNISILAGAISFIPGGIGATEAAISILLIGIGMDMSLAVIASIVVRGMTLWFAIVLGLLSMFSLNFLL